MNVPDEKLVDRVVGRRMDPETGKIYHLTFSPPESEEVAARLVSYRTRVLATEAP